MQRLVILTGAGMSQESGIRTFRDSDGLWEEYRVEEVATPEAWHKNPELVQRFYNERRKQLLNCEPNAGHIGIAELEKHFDVSIITQNIDDLHERAGSTNVIHLHGELKKARSSVDPSLIYDIDGWELKMGQKCQKGNQLRPHIVWFGEAVPAIEEAAVKSAAADIFFIVGTSLSVYPAAGLLGYVPKQVPVFLIDSKPTVRSSEHVQVFAEPAGTGIPMCIEHLQRSGLLPHLG